MNLDMAGARPQVAARHELLKFGRSYEVLCLAALFDKVLAMLRLALLARALHEHEEMHLSLLHA